MTKPGRELGLLHEVFNDAGKGGVEVKIDAEQADRAAALSLDDDRRRLEGLSFFVLRAVGDVAVVAVRLDPGEHVQRQVGDGRAPPCVRCNAR